MSATRSSIPRPAPERLAHLYTTLGLSCPDIGWLYERDAKTIHWWLRQAGIPTRPRGSNPAQHFKAGERSAFAGRRHTPESIAKIKAATVANGRVPCLRNGQHWLKGQPAEVNPNWKGGATPERQEFYRTPEWRGACRAVWARDNGCCRNCGKDYRVARRTEPTFHVHHVVSFQVPQHRANPAFMVLLCRGCHLWVHSKSNITHAWLPQLPGDPVQFPGLAGLDDIEPIDVDAWLAAERRGREAYRQSRKREFSTPSLFDLLELEEQAV